MKPASRKEEILSVAARLFKDRGFSAVSVRDIADTLDIKAASLYYHIASKQEILVQIIIRVAEEFNLGMKAIVATASSPAQKIEKVIALHVDVSLRNTDDIACLNSDWMHLEEPQLSYFKQMRTGYESDFRKMIQAGVQAGEIQSQNVELTLFSILSTLRTLYLWYPKKGASAQEKLTEELTQILLRGILV